MMRVGAVELLLICGFIGVILLAIAAVVIVIVLVTRSNRVPCPYCGERITKDAVLCRYCGREVKPGPGSPVEGAASRGGGTPPPAGES